MNEGYGMKGIRERVKKLNGDVQFKSCDGFNVKGIIYLEKENRVVLHREEKR